MKYDDHLTLSYGRIGRIVFRILQDRPEFEVVAINE